MTFLSTHTSVIIIPLSVEQTHDLYSLGRLASSPTTN